MAVPSVPSLSPHERQALDALVRRHQSQVRGLAARLAPIPADADDLAQEAFLVLLRRRADFDLAQDPTPLLAAIVRNLCRQAWDRVAKDRRFRRDELADYVASIDALPDLGDEASRTALRACLARLGDKERSLINLRYTAECSSDQIATRLGSSGDAVRMALSRIRQRLRACIERVAAGGETA